MSAPDPHSHEKEPPAVIAEIEASQPPMQGVNMSGESVGTLDEVGVAVESRLNRLKRIGKPIASFFSVQIIVQILTMLSGLLLVRYMGKTEYAYYTIINTMQGAIGVLGDSGITSALSSIGGVVWRDKRRFGELIQTALSFRRKFGVLVFTVIGPLMLWLLHTNGSGLFYSLLLSGLVLTGSSLSLVHGVLIMVPRLHSRINQIQKAELMLAGLRLVLVGAACLLFVDAAIAAAIFLLTLAIQNVLYRRWAAEDADLSAPINTSDTAEIWKMVRYQAPGTIFYCLQSQLFIFVIGYFGSTSDVANVGALGRLTIVFSIISVIMTNVILPQVARCQEKRGLQKLYLQVLGFYIVLGSFFMLIVALFPNPMLWLLGGKYANLGSELSYLTFNAVIGAIVGILFSLNSTRGWIKGSWVFIPISLIAQVAMLPFVNLSSIKDVALLSALPTLAGGLYYAALARRALHNFKEPHCFRLISTAIS